MTKRKYTQRRRASQQEQTRARIVEATMALHEELGPKETTVSAIAKRAGVQRLTVYRHFPDEGALLQACTSRWLALNPPPDPARWAAVDEAAPRCRAALAALYGYYGATEAMWVRSYRDQEEVPALKAQMDRFHAYLDTVAEDLLGAWRRQGGKGKALQATIGHGLRFTTWQSLAAEGLKDDAKAALVVDWMAAVAGR